MDGLRKFIMVDNHEVVRVGELDKNVQSRTVVKPKSTTDFPEAVVREGAGPPTVRADVEGMLRTFIDTPNLGDKKIGEPPLVEEDWHAGCKAIYKGVDGTEWEKLGKKKRVDISQHSPHECQSQGQKSLLEGKRNLGEWRRSLR